MANPLLDWGGPWPPWEAINPERHAPSALEAAIAEAERALARARSARGLVALLDALDAAEEVLHRAWSPVRHLEAVASRPELRAIVEAGEARVERFLGAARQDPRIFARLQKLAAKARQKTFRRAAEIRRLEMELAGAGLAGEARARFLDIQAELARLAVRFEAQVLDASQRVVLHVRDRGELAGIPEHVQAEAERIARAHGLSGYAFTLDEALVGPALSHAENRALRRRLHRAWAARASRGRFDTTPLILRILALREEAARLLGFPHYAEMALGLRMCSSAARLEAFLEELTRAVRPHAEEEYARLQAFAAKELGLRRLAPHDLAFAMERMRRARFVDEEALRPWFPASQVVAGALAIAERMFGIRFVEEPEAPRWHSEVRCLRVEERGRTRGWLYLDLFMRTGKRGGAWMDEGAIGWRHPQRTTLPVAYIVASFARAEGQEPLWTPSDAETLLHELGHALHLVLCERTRVRSLSGLGGVPWDAVELPSQWLEQAASTPWGLRLLSRHWRTGEPLSRAQIARLIASRRFLGALRLARQLEYAWMDFALHTQPAPADAVELRRRVRQARDRAAVVPRAGYDRTENSFTHIFAGGYAAGYYSYLWAETMAADAWHATAPDARPRIRRARAFRREILAIGGTRPMDEAIRRFLGRPPEMQALLRRWGIEA